MDLSDSVKELRRELAESQRALATRLGVSLSAVARYERGRTPTGRALAALARVAEEAGRPDLAGIFLTALVNELRLQKSVGILHGAYDAEGTKLEGVLYLPFEGLDQLHYAWAFLSAFRVHTRPESFLRPRSPKALAAAEKMLSDLARAADETWPDPAS